MFISLTKSKQGEYTATATAGGQFLASATSRRKKEAQDDARRLGQEALQQRNRPAEPALLTTSLPGKLLAPEFSAGPLPLCQLVQNLRTVSRLG